MRIEKRQIDSLKPNVWNPNELDDFTMASLAGNIKRFGYLQPILINIDGEIVDGYHRWVAAKEAGLKEVECVVIERPEEERKVLTLAMNNIRGEPNPIELSALLDDLLQEMNTHDLSVMTGYTDKDIEEILGGLDTGEGFTDPDEVPEVSEEPITKLGDLWILGDHRLLCGDSTRREDVDKLMEGDTAGVVLTDPPYQAGKNIVGDSLSDQEYRQLHELFIKNLPVKSNSIFISFHSPRTFPVLLDVAGKDGWVFGRMLWLIEQGTNVFPWHGWYMHGQAILVFYRGIGCWPDRYIPSQDTYIIHLADNSTEINKKNITDICIMDHPTLKPLSVVENILGHTDNSKVYDPFCGSGTMIIATERLGRRSFSMEIDPKYVDVAVKRWENYTGRKAERE